MRKPEKRGFIFGKLNMSFSSEGRKQREVKTIVTGISIARQRVVKSTPTTHVQAAIKKTFARQTCIRNNRGSGVLYVFRATHSDT
jgi:hypothetical protein